MESDVIVNEKNSLQKNIKFDILKKKLGGTKNDASRQKFHRYM